MNHILRFAPSPTGFLHVGGARTAIFNWLIARQGGGKFLLRIEDTDRSRSTEESIKQIFSSLQWLGLDWDGEVVYQSARLQRHLNIARQLLNTGYAYRCFCTKIELDEKRRLAEKRKDNRRYDGTCRKLTQTEIDQKLDEKSHYSIRLKISGTTLKFTDLVHGQTSHDLNSMDDFIIVRSDGTPVYQLAVVVDDHDAGVNFILRGDDHLNNTPKQILLYRALGWPLPEFGHLPLILGPDKQRLSKRHGASKVEEFKEKGILPEALFNYLCLLGWSPGDDSEIITKEDLIANFSIERINKPAAVFDEKKLFWMNNRYILKMPLEQVLQYAYEWLDEKDFHLPEEEQKRFNMLIELLQKRAKTMQELKDSLKVYFEYPLEYDERGVNKFFLNGKTAEYLSDISDRIENTDSSMFLKLKEIEKFIRTFADEKNVSAAKIIHPLRLALTGKTESPGIFELIYILGKEKVIDRLSLAGSYIKQLQKND